MHTHTHTRTQSHNTCTPTHTHAVLSHTHKHTRIANLHTLSHTHTHTRTHHTLSWEAGPRITVKTPEQTLSHRPVWSWPAANIQCFNDSGYHVDHTGCTLPCQPHRVKTPSDPVHMSMLLTCETYDTPKQHFPFKIPADSVSLMAMSN